MLTDKEQKILDSIIVASENDPNRPEFPMDDPKFPATPTYQIKVPGFTNVWLKDESHNPTGTHKDRMAWEIVVTYRDFLLAKERGQFTGDLPVFSIISSGSAANAVQSMLRKFDLPNLKVLVDLHLDAPVKQQLKDLGCEIYQTDLRIKKLDAQEILRLTNNKNGFDITSSEALDPTTRYYDWLSYEIMNTSPEYCFIPFGTGHLYENILNVNKREVSSKNHDPRFSGNMETLRACNFMGATTDNKDSKIADKLYSPHLPFVHFNEQWINLYKKAGYCGKDSDVQIVREEFVDEAMQVADENGFDYEPSAIAGLALLLQMKDVVPADAKVLIVSTGKTKID